MDGLVKAGSVNCDEEPILCQKADIHEYPTVRFYKGARREGMSQVCIIDNVLSFKHTVECEGWESFLL